MKRSEKLLPIDLLFPFVIETTLECARRLALYSDFSFQMFYCSKGRITARRASCCTARVYFWTRMYLKTSITYLGVLCGRTQFINISLSSRRALIVLRIYNLETLIFFGLSILYQLQKNLRGNLRFTCIGTAKAESSKRTYSIPSRFDIFALCCCGLVASEYFLSSLMFLLTVGRIQEHAV